MVLHFSKRRLAKTLQALYRDKVDQHQAGCLWSVFSPPKNATFFGNTDETPINLVWKLNWGVTMSLFNSWDCIKCDFFFWDQETQTFPMAMMWDHLLRHHGLLFFAYQTYNGRLDSAGFPYLWRVLVKTLDDHGNHRWLGQSEGCVFNSI